MSAVPIQISGVLYDKTARTQQSVVLVGSASIVGLSVGGGPIVPPEEVPPGGGQPPVIWPSPGVPTHPIVLPPPGTPAHPIVLPPEPPTSPGSPAFPIWGPPGVDFPDVPGYPPVAGHPLPPIPPSTEPPQEIIGWEAKIFWTEATGWGVVIVPKEGTAVPTPSKR